MFRIHKLLGFSDPDKYFLHGSGSGSGSFRKKTEKIKKNLVSATLWLLNDLLSLKIDVTIPEVRNKQKNLAKTT